MFESTCAGDAAVVIPAADVALSWDGDQFHDAENCRIVLVFFPLIRRIADDPVTMQQRLATADE
eukprot:scaffold91444_cov52-Attheya_sp.AAC.1